MYRLFRDLRIGTCTLPQRPCLAVLTQSGLPAVIVMVLGTTMLSPCLDAAEDKQAVYEKDVEFLLTELEKRAGHFFDVKGVDWPAVGEQFRREVTTVENDAEHLELCLRLLARLKDGHAGLYDLKMEIPEKWRQRKLSGPGVRLMTIGDRVYIRYAFRSAAQLGIATGMEVVKIDGLPAFDWLQKRVATLRDDRGYSTDHQALYAACHWGMADQEGTQIEFELAGAERNRTIKIMRRGDPAVAPLGPIFLPEGLKRIGRQRYGKTEGGFGYIHLRDVPGSLPEQLDTMLEAIGDAPGFILDMRANGGGGCDHEAVFGRFLPEGKRWRQYTGAGKTPFAGPLVVIVDSGTRSAGETVAGMFREDGRAYTIGDGPTAGTSSQKQSLALPSGLFSVRFSVRSNKKRFNNGRGVEGIGVPPHELVPYDPADLVKGIDTQIRRAEELLRKGLPKDAVPYEAARDQNHPPEGNGTRGQEIRRFPSTFAPLSSSGPSRIRTTQTQRSPAHDSVSIDPVCRHFAHRWVSEFGRANLGTGHGDHPGRALDAANGLLGHGKEISKGSSLARRLQLLGTWTFHDNLPNA